MVVSGDKTPESSDRLNILVVDDDPAIIALVEKVLKREGYGTMTANNGAQGLELFLAHRERVDAVILDILMPGMRGTDMLALMREHKPELPALIISGYGLGSVANPPALDEDRTVFIPKPFTIAALRQALERILLRALG